MNAEKKALARLRRYCGSLPETSEKESWGHPNFRAGKRTFATFEWIKGRPSIAILVGAEEADALLLAPGVFFATPYGQGKWVSIWADGALDWGFLEELLERGYRQVALKGMISTLEEKRARTGSAKSGHE